MNDTENNVPYQKTLLVRKTPPIILKWRQDLTHIGQEGAEAQEKVTYSRTPGKKESNRQQEVMIFCGQQT